MKESDDEEHAEPIWSVLDRNQSYWSSRGHWYCGQTNQGLSYIADEIPEGTTVSEIDLVQCLC